MNVKCNPSDSKDRTQSHFAVRNEVNGRENNEDSFQMFRLIPGLSTAYIDVLAIADGMGGHDHGEDVSREALRRMSLSLVEQLSIDQNLNALSSNEITDVTTLSRALWSAVEQANAHVLRMIQTNRWGKAGTTIVVPAIVEDTVVVANVGDSPLYHYQINTGALTKVTVDHSVAGVLLQAGLINTEMVRHHEGRSQLEFYLGGKKLPREVPLSQRQLMAGDILLLCSDGISSALRAEQLSKILASPGADLEEIADRLLRAAVEAGETDNQTLILWQHRPGLGGAPLTRPSAVAGQATPQLETLTVAEGSASPLVSVAPEEEQGQVTEPPGDENVGDRNISAGGVSDMTTSARLAAHENHLIMPSPDAQP